MKLELREDSVLITGYVNAIERNSKPIRETLHGKIRTFLERIKAGAFRTALKRNDNVLVLLNHNHDRVLAQTKDNSAKLEEDNIGLRAEITITDKEVVEDARNGKLSGWSFGFYANSDELSQEGNNEIRTVTDLDLIEVSILDNTKSPAYYGTLIEARAEDSKQLELRATSFEEIDEEAKEKHEVLYEVTEKEHEAIDEEAEEKKIDIIVDKVLEKLKELEETREEQPANEQVDEQVEQKTTEVIDYSSFEDRIKKL